MSDAYIFELLAGVLYLAAGLLLLHRAVRAGGGAERVLGATVLLMGASYVFYELPLAAHAPDWKQWATPIGRILFDVSVVALAVFVRRTFHAGRSWASAVVAGTLLLLASGCAVAVWEGDWLGYAPLDTWGFWLEWVGQLLPAAWLAIEAGVHHARARRQRSLGLCDPLSCHRLLLLSLFGLMQVCASFIVVPMYVEFATLSRFSVLMDALLGVFEIASALLVWLAYLPPAAYRSWAARGSADPGEGRAR